jgi:LPS-assembly lipoprotein
MYGPNGGANANDPALRDELAAVRVPVLQERFGQLVRRSLTQRLGTTIGGPMPARYELRVGPGVQAEALAFQLDGTATRVRYIATTNWLLVRLGPPPEGIASGTERTIDAFNIPPNQYFASDSSREAAEHRLAEILAEQVVQRVAVEFRRRQEAGAAAAAAVPVPAAMPVAPAEAPPPDFSQPLQRGPVPGLGPMR